jgi:hypothetical protein
VEQIRVEQGRESALFLGIFSEHAVHPFVCAREAALDLPSDPLMLPPRGFETQSLQLGFQHEGTYTTQCDLSKLHTTGLLSTRGYVFCFPSEGQVVCSCILGGDAPQLVNTHTTAWANMLAMKIGTEVRMMEWGTSAATAISQIVDSPVTANNVRVSRTVTRPKRLWTVSNDRRGLGAMFVEEVGQGGTFTQDDINARDGSECCILDGGAQLFVRHGPKSDLPTRYLATRVARAFVERVGAGTEVVHVESASEPVELTALFRSWDTQLCAVPNETARKFVPANVGKQDDMGHVEDPTAKAAPKSSTPAGMRKEEGAGAGTYRQSTEAEVASSSCFCTVM